MENEFFSQATTMRDQLIRWRRDLHQMPEVGLHLPNTVQYIRQELENMGLCPIVHEEISCVQATVGQGKALFLLRADMDALPIREQTGLPFAADNGNMHACGHDLHGAMLLGAAKLLKQAHFPGRVRLLFQSGEEIFRGAQAAVDAGALEGVGAAFAVHVVGMLPMGIALTGKAPMAAVDEFRITVTGKGGHGSMPEGCIDPILAGVQLHLALQSLIAREVGGTEEAVLTVGVFQAGQSANAIPEQAILEGTLRSFGEDLRRRLLERMEQVCLGVAAVYRCGATFHIPARCAGVVTEEGVTAAGESALAQIAPDWQLRRNAHGMGSEDFAQISTRVPSGYFLLGAGPEAEELRYPQHNPNIQFNEDILPLGAALLAQTAVNWLTGEKQAFTVQTEKDMV